MLARRDAELSQAFRALSAEALAANNEQFVALAEGRIKEAAAALAGDAAVRDKAIGALLDPMSTALQRVEGQLRDVEKERQSAYIGLREQVDAMRRQLGAAAVRDEVAGQRPARAAGPRAVGRAAARTRGAAGRDGRALRLLHAGRTGRRGADGTIRPDMVVHLAGGKSIVVDAKVPFAGYLEAVESRDPDTHADRLAAHARQLRAHVDTLAAKAYWAAFEPSPEFVVLFVPGDPFLEAALQADPTLLEHAFGRNVVIATPTTLIALLRTVAYSWRQEALARNAAAIHQLGKELHARLATMGTHVAKLGRSLDGAVDSYNKTVSSLEARVLVTARRLTELKVADDELTAPAPVDRSPRRVSAPELVASADDALVALPGERDAG